MNTPIAGVLEKMGAYLGAAIATRSANLAGLPLLPKRMLMNTPHNRAAYNTFIRWIRTDLALRKAAVVFDVGANHGDFARAASACFPEATVYLFEPVPELQPILRRQAQRYPSRWNVEPVALGAEAGSMLMDISAEDDTIGSLVGFSDAYRVMNPAARTGRRINVAVDSVADFCARRDVQHIDLLKVDVEGFEFEVMRGTAHMLERISAVIVEVSLVRKPSGASDQLVEMLRLLVSAGFSIVDVKPSISSQVVTEPPWKPFEFNVLARR